MPATTALPSLLSAPARANVRGCFSSHYTSRIKPLKDNSRQLWRGATRFQARPDREQQVATAPPAHLDTVPQTSFQALIDDKKFFCTQCGKCCTGSGEVWVSNEEIERMAKHLNLSTTRFISTYCKSYGKVEGWRLLRNRLEDDGCIFLGDNNLCRIHQVRPLQCSTYPWWPELMAKRDWESEKEHVCEGLDHQDAGATDVVAAAQQLRDSSVYFMKLRIAQGRVADQEQFLADTLPQLPDSRLE